MGDLVNTLESVPSWVWVVALVGVVLLSLLKSNGNSTSSLGGVNVLQPIPADPNLVQLAATESNNKTAAFNSLLDLFGTTQVSQISANRDTAIAGLQADAQNRLTQASLDAAIAADNVQQTLGLASTNAQLLASYDTNQTTRAGQATQAATDAATANAQVQEAQINADAATKINAQNTNSAKAQSHNNVVGNVISTIGRVVGSFFGF